MNDQIIDGCLLVFGVSNTWQRESAGMGSAALAIGASFYKCLQEAGQSECETDRWFTEYKVSLGLDGAPLLPINDRLMDDAVLRVMALGVKPLDVARMLLAILPSWTNGLHQGTSRLDQFHDKLARQVEVCG